MKNPLVNAFVVGDIICRHSDKKEYPVISIKMWGVLIPERIFVEHGSYTIIKKHEKI